MEGTFVSFLNVILPCLSSLIPPSNVHTHIFLMSSRDTNPGFNNPFFRNIAGTEATSKGSLVYLFTLVEDIMAVK